MNNMLWVEKYRPNNIYDIIQQDEIITIVKNNNYSNLPHIILYGSNGTGKTSTALAICKHIFSKNKKILNERVLELNASDDRGIKVVREKIKVFASHALNNYDNIPNIKIIILDEADIMTNDSQFALRRIIEQYSHITRFILICNILTKIIPPLISRCAKYKFNKIELNSMKIIFYKILSKEKIDLILINDIIIEKIYQYSYGDLRKGITLLQRYYLLLQSNSDLNIDELSNIISHNKILEGFNILKLKVDNYNTIIEYIKSIINEGYYSIDLIIQISDLILNDTSINDTIKSNIFIKIANIDNLLKTRSSEYIQILALFTFINHSLNNNILL